MPDYDLGRARGEVVITADTRDVDQAAASVAGLEAESKTLNRTLGDSERALNRSEEAHRRHKREVADSKSELRKYADEVENVEKKLKSLSSTMTTVVAGAFKSIGLLGAVGAAGGGIGLLGGGGVQGIVAITEAVGQLSGAFLLLPAAVAGAGAALGTLAVGFHGVGDALKAMDDPAKFTQALRELAPAAQEAVRTLASFHSAFKGAMQAVQQSLFAPIVQDIQPLVYTWLPALMNAGKQLASIFGQAGHIFTQWLQQPQVMAQFQGFINNLSNAFRTMLPAIQAVANGFLTLTSVGGQAFPRIAESIVRIANAFNEWVQGAARSGELSAWINSAITGFEQLWDITKNFFSALQNINAIGTQFGGGLLDTLQRITATFREWTESTKGQVVLADFFEATHQAAVALSPILKTLGQDLFILFGSLARLGATLGPGIGNLLHSLGVALNELVNALSNSGGGLNDGLTALGNALVQIVQAVGPQLPGIFRNFASVLEDLGPIVAAVAEHVATLLGNMTPAQTEVVLGLVGAFTALVKVLPLVRAAMVALDIAMDANPIGLVILAIGALVAAGIYMATHWDQVKAKASELWDTLKGLGEWISNGLVSAFDTAITNLSNYWTNFINRAKDWGSNLVQNIIDGVYDMAKPLTDAASWIAEIFTDHTATHSPAKKGPLNTNPPDVMGANLSRNFAAGIQQGSGAVTAAASGTAGGAVSGFTSAGVSGTSGKAGQSGFEQWVKGLTDDLSAWSQIARSGFDLFKNIADIFVTTTKVVASLWNQGDNPLTQPGGIAGPPSGTGQVSIFGVPSGTPAPGKAPLPQLTPQGQPGAKGPGVPQASVPGVPNAPGPGSAGGPPPANTSTGAAPPAQQPAPAGQQGGTGGLPKYTGQDADLAAELKKHGFTDSQVIGLVALNSVETGNWSHPESIMGFTNQQTGPGIQAHVAGFKEMWDRRQSTGAVVAAGQPDSGIDAAGNVTDPAKYANWLLKLEGYSATTDWAGNKYAPGQFMSDQAYAGRVVDAYKNLPPAAPAPGGASVSGRVTAPGAVDRGFFGPLGPTGTAGADTGTVKGDANAVNPQTGLTDQQATDILYGNAPKGSSIFGPGGGNVQGQAPASAPTFQPQPYGLPSGTNTGGYGSGGKGVFPQWVLDLGAQFGVTPSTYPEHQESNRNERGYAPNPQNQNRGIDWVGTPENMERFAQALIAYGGAEGSGGALEQVIYQAGPGGAKYGLGGAGNIKPDYYDQGTYAEHGGGPTGAHVHTRFSGSVPVNLNSVQGQQPPAVQGDDFFGPAIGAQRNLPQYDPNASIFGPSGTGGTPAEQEQAKRYDPNASIFGPGTQDRSTQFPQGVGRGVGSSTQGVIRPSDPGTGQPFDQGPQSNKSPLDSFTSAMGAVGSIAGDAFKIFDDIIKNISAEADIINTTVRGVANTEDIMRLIDNFQTFITTAADVAGLVKDVGGIVAGAGGGDPSGITGAVGSGIQAIAGIVESALQATNAAIDLGQQIYHEVGKYAATIAGITLGGPNTGPLGGNVRMLLNTNTGQVITYSEDNPQNQNVKNLPIGFSQAYGGLRQAPAVQQNNLNMYVGPGPDPMRMMQDTMWLVGTGAPEVASVAGHE